MAVTGFVVLKHQISYRTMKSEESPGFELVSTDGSSLNNGKKTAVAGTGVYFGSNDPS